MNQLITRALQFTLLLALASGAYAVDYWSGGAGKESREAAPTDLNTTFEFFARDGSFLSGVWAEISHVEGGEMVLEVMTQGPWLMVDLEDGYYRIEATRLGTGEVQRVRFEVTDGSAQKMGLRYME